MYAAVVKGKYVKGENSACCHIQTSSTTKSLYNHVSCLCSKSTSSFYVHWSSEDIFRCPKHRKGVIPQLFLQFVIIRHLSYLFDLIMFGCGPASCLSFTPLWIKGATLYANGCMIVVVVHTKKMLTSCSLSRFR